MKRFLPLHRGDEQRDRKRIGRDGYERFVLDRVVEIQFERTWCVLAHHFADEAHTLSDSSEGDGIQLHGVLGSVPADCSLWIAAAGTGRTDRTGPPTSQ